MAFGPVHPRRIQILINEPQVPDIQESIDYFESMAFLLETLRMAQKNLRFVMK